MGFKKNFVSHDTNKALVKWQGGATRFLKNGAWEGIEGPRFESQGRHVVTF